VWEERLGAAQEMLRSISTPEDLPRSLTLEAVQRISELTALLPEREMDEQRLTAQFVLGWLHWNRFLALPEDMGGGDLAAAVSLFVPVFVNEPDPAAVLPDLLVPEIAERIVPVAVELLQHVAVSPDPGVLDAAVQLWGRIATAIPEDHPSRSGYLSNLGIALVFRYNRLGQPDDLDEAIDVGRAAVAAPPPGAPPETRWR
jgi:hypothetical protein